MQRSMQPSEESWTYSHGSTRWGSGRNEDAVPEEFVEYENALPLKSMLHEYRLDSVLGAGGFGITYLAWDTHLEKNVAIKEYLPGELAMRALDGSVLPVNTDHKQNYHWGLERFMQEARTLAKFSHPNIVRVSRYFEANGTSYMVMDYEAGESLHQYLKRGPAPDEAALTAMLMPILDGLQAVHQAGFLHRDIKPSNVFIRKDGTPVLLDFGSSRFAGGGEPRNLTAIVTPGYAPLEQYSGDGNQGPWSDIYALAGVLFRAVTGEHPPDAIRRLKSDTASSTLTAARSRFSARFLDAIERGLNRDEKLRPRSVAEWREQFRGGPAQTARPAPPAGDPARPRTDRPPAASAPAAGTRNSRPGSAARASRAAGDDSPAPSGWKWLSLAALAVIAALVVVLYLRQRAAELESRAIPYSQPRQAPAPGKPQPPVPGPPPVPEQAPASGEAQQPPLGPPPVPEEAPARANARQPASGPPPSPREATADADPPPSLLQEFKGADRNADGYLSPDEVRGRFPYIEANFASVDTDGDGRISPRELWQLRKNQRTMKRR
jgi:serine/threonine protein kinase